jgi:hypothetical protein
LAVSEVNTDQAIFDAISAAVSVRNFDATSIGIVIDTKAFIETFNNHRDRKLCTSLDTSVPTKPGSDDRPIPSYGQIPWKQLGRDVMDAMYAKRTDYEFDPSYYPGHQMLPTLNFNSLARIVDKYRYYGNAAPMLPCPVCGGEAIHAIDTLKRVIIKGENE